MTNISTDVLTRFIDLEGTADLTQRISVMWKGEIPNWKVLMTDYKWGSRDGR